MTIRMLDDQQDPNAEPPRTLRMLPPGPDKYQQAALEERAKRLAEGTQTDDGYNRRMASGPLLGWQDEIGAAVRVPAEMIKRGTFNPVEAYRYGKASEELKSEKAAEKTGLAGDVLSGVSGLAMLPSNVFGRQLAGALGGARAGVPGFAGRVAGYGTEAATLGAVQGAGNAETMADIPREAVKGGIVGGVIGGGIGGVAGDVARRSSAAVPTREELMTLGARDYRARDRLPVSYDLEKVGNRLRDVGQATRNKYGRDAPNTVNYLRNLSEEAAADVAAARAANPNPPNQVAAGPSGAPNQWQATATPRDIASLRREIYKRGATGEPTDERAGVVASKIIDRIASRPNPAMLAQGVNPRDAVAAAMLNTRGRGNFAGAYRTKAVDEAIDASTRTAGGQHSGLNFENILRQNLNKARKAEDFGRLNAAEEAALERLIVGTTAANSKRELGNMLGGGGGLGRMVAMGGSGAVGGGALSAYATGGDPWAGAALGAAAGLTGRGLRVSGNRQARRSTEEFGDMIRRSTPEYRRRAAVAPMVAGPGITSPTADALRRVYIYGDEGGPRDAVANALIYQTTGERPKKKPRSGD